MTPPGRARIPQEPVARPAVRTLGAWIFARSAGTTGSRRHFARFAADGCVPGRVTLEHQHIYTIHTGHSDLLATVAGSLRHRITARREFPAVGDWVALRALEAGRRAVIQAVLPRRSKFSRKVAGGEPTSRSSRPTSTRCS